MTSVRNTVLRSLHDVGLAAWFGGSLMGAVGLNGAAKNHSGSWKDNAALASSGWRRWTPVSAAAIGMHLIGSSGLLAVNAARVAPQPGAAASTLARTVLTGAALAATAYARTLGKRIELVSLDLPDLAEDVEGRPYDTLRAERHLSYIQWVVPALTGGLMIFDAFHGEQQLPTSPIHGLWRRAGSSPPHLPQVQDWYRVS